MDGANWTGGLYWQESEYDNNNIGALIGAAGPPAPLIGTVPVADNRAAPPFPNDTYFDEEAEWLSAYFSLGIALGDRVTLDIGARYTDVEKTALMQNGTGYYDFAGGVIVGLIDSDNGPGCAIGTEVNAFAMGGGFDPNAEVCVAGAVDNSSTDPQIQLSGYVSDDTMLFARYAEGFKSGGFSVGMSAPDIAQFVYNPEEAETFEVGVKTGFADGRGELSVVLFTTEFTNRQVSALSPVFAGAPEFIIQNAAASTSEGIEFDGRFAATDNLTFTFSGSILDSVYDSYTAAACNDYKDARGQNGCGGGQATFDASGFDTAGSQPWELMLGTRWSKPLGNGGRITFNADLALIDYHNVFGLNFIEESQFRNGTEEQLNMRLSYMPASARYEIALYADNVTDNRRFVGVGSDALGYEENITISRVQGSTYGLQARFNFGN